MVATRNLVFARETGLDRDVAFGLIAETMSHAERAFGSTTHGHLLERYALEAATDLLSRPATVLDFAPELAVHDARRSHAAR